MRASILQVIVVAVTVVALLAVAFASSRVGDLEPVPPDQILAEYRGVTGVEVRETALLGGTVYVWDEQLSRVDGATAAALASVAAISAFLLALLRGSATAASREGTAFFKVAAAGAAFVAFDELVSLHETVGYNLSFLREVPGFARPDDALVALYLLAALLVVARYRTFLRGSTTAIRLLGSAAACFVVAVALDIVASTPLEEALEFAGSALAITGVAALGREHIWRAWAASAAS
jgi:hypothetical protein